MTNFTANLPQPEEGQRRLFLKAGCPFCTKLVVFITAAGLQHKFKPIYDCPPVREYVAAVNDGRCTFPCMELEPESVVMLETSDINAKLAEENGIDMDALWAYNYFEGGMLRSFSALFGYLVQNEGGYPEARQWFADKANMIQTPCPPEGAAEVL